MSPRLLRAGRVALLLSSAFLVGGASAEVAVRTRATVDHVRRDRELGSAGELVALQLTGPDGEVVAQPRLIAPAGKAAELVLHQPGRPGAVRVAFRVAAVRQASGRISLDYELWIPEHDVVTRGRICLAPGVKQAIPLPQGELVATWLAVPVPSAQFDEYLESERAARRSPPEPS